MNYKSHTLILKITKKFFQLIYQFIHQCSFVIQSVILMEIKANYMWYYFMLLYCLSLIFFLQIVAGMKLFTLISTNRNKILSTSSNTIGMCVKVRPAIFRLAIFCSYSSNTTSNRNITIALTIPIIVEVCLVAKRFQSRCTLTFRFNNVTCVAANISSRSIIVL